MCSRWLHTTSAADNDKHFPDFTIEVLWHVLQATNAELEQVKQQGSIADERAQEFETQVRTLEQTLEHAKAAAETRIAEISQQKEHLQQNNSKLVLSNLMLMNKAKVLEDHSRALVERQEDLKHQVSLTKTTTKQASNDQHNRCTLITAKANAHHCHKCAMSRGTELTNQPVC